MSIGTAITEWASAQRRWQQVALRMLTETSELTSVQVETLAGAALTETGHAPPFGDHADDAILTAAHLGTMTVGRPKVRVTAVENAYRVNRLAADQKLRFAPEGLTVVYGDNGSGKSGYARVLKRICGSRCAGSPILPNVYDADKGQGAGATIHFEVDGVEDHLDWQDGKDVAPILPEVGFFDLECAAVQVSAENTVLLTPPGLDLLERFADACGSVRDRLGAYREQLNAVSPHLQIPDEHAGTKVDLLLANLSHQTDLATLEARVPLSQEEQARLLELESAAREDPVEVAKNCRVLDGVLASVEAAAASLRSSLAEDSIAIRDRRAVEVEAAREAATLSSAELFSSEPLSGVGSDVWKVLWEAARAYSVQAAYPGRDFPVVDENAACLLCQQPLSTAAADRFTRFEEHVKEATQAALQSALVRLGESEGMYQDARLAVSGLEQSINVIEIDDPNLAAQCETFVTRVTEGDEMFPSHDDVGLLREAAQRLIAELAGKQSSVQLRLCRAEETSDAEAAERRNREITELRARKWLATKLPDVRSRVDTLKSIACVDQAQGTCDTTTTSVFAGKLATQHVTDKLEQAFIDELRILQAHQLPVILARSRTRKGSSLHRLELSGLKCKASPRQVLSEGEQKCIALAAFLAETDLRDDGSGIVLDDPVTSLDHRWRIEVARRLAMEASKRQVVVFTHDIVFLMALLEETKQKGVPSAELLLRRSAKEVGLCEDGLPWAGMTVGKRLGVLRNRAQRARSIWIKEGEASYEPFARITYSMLREAWERGVEELLLNEAVVRLRRSVETKRLRKLFDITEQDVEAVDTAMARCSNFMLGHDEASAINECVPGPDELDADVSALASWVEAIRQRRG